MVTLIKHEWHQVDRQFTVSLDMDLLKKIYPNLKKNDLKKKIEKIKSGEISVDQILEDIAEVDIEIDWEHSGDDWWTYRKGGYDTTFELDDESSDK